MLYVKMLAGAWPNTVSCIVYNKEKGNKEGQLFGRIPVLKSPGIGVFS